MFKPNFKYTDKIVKFLIKISASRELILNSPFIPQWELTLRKETIIHSAHSSTRIEGNRLSLEQVTDLAIGREVMATRKDKQEVLNYLNVLEKINNLIGDSYLKEKDILKIHRMVTKGTLENPADCGVYRNQYVVVGNKFTGEIYFKPPQNKDVPKLINGLIDWINLEETEELDPVIEAGISHYKFVRIHPFIDGNGRTARILAALILYLRGFDTKQFFCLDDFYDFDRPSYYSALQNVNQKILDLTSWLDYFCEGVYVSLKAVKERVVRLSIERLRKSQEGQSALTERQMRIVEFININGKITNRDVREMFKLSNRVALDEINKLIELRVLKSNGKGRGIHYVLD